MADQTHYKKAVFAGGCFWCMEPPYDKTDGVITVLSGYSGGTAEDANYGAVSGGYTDHYEVIEVTYDPEKVTYDQLLDVFWVNIDPLDPTGQFCDKGAQYRAAIFYKDDEEKAVAEASRDRLNASGVLPSPVITEILPAQKFYAAEDYHQDYYIKNPWRYRFYRGRCGRDQRLRQLWGNPKRKMKTGLND